MKWEGGRQSSNVEDRRDGSAGTAGGGGRRVGGRGVGLGTVAIALVAGWVFGINPLTVLGLLGGEGGGLPAPAPQVQQAPAAHPQDPMGQFVATVLADTEDVWRELFRAQGGQYQDPKLVLFRGATPTACGTGQTAMGPFYCPGDHKVYLDLGFFDTLSQQLGAPGDFAAAYVIAHEVGHHLQNLLGLSAKVQQARQRVGRAEGNVLSVKLELQADCFAGVWAHHSQKGKGWLDASDIQAALNAASRIGDDVLQKAARGTVVPESFTHGSAAQRQRWFQTGLNKGTLEACDTFAARSI